MKKLTCSLLVAMFTMTSMLFAQISGGPIVVVSDYITITNKTTKESKTISTSDFTSAGNDKYTYDVDFCLGVYKNDEIEVTYTPKASLAPQIAWTYSWSDGFSSSLGTALTANLSANNVPSDKSVLTFTCNYLGTKQKPTSIFYSIRLKNVHDNTRFYSDYDSYNNLLRVTYRNYSEVSSCLTKAPYVAVYNSSTGIGVFNGSMNNGIITFNTGGLRGFFIVKVTVNNVILPGEQIYLY